MVSTKRDDGRANDELRKVTIEPGIAPQADGSVLCSFGNTRIICAANLESRVPRWMREQSVEGGWMTAEYSMLPYCTYPRKQRDITRGKSDGRTIEIQRLIGRAMRAVTDLSRIPGHTLTIDCDVLQADGGTRTASITGAYVAASIAVQKHIQKGTFEQSPFVDQVAAISAGICSGSAMLDLCYTEDRDASVDANIVMSGKGQFVEIQSSGEESTFSEDELHSILNVSKLGLKQIFELQNKAIEAAAVAG